MRKGFHKIGVKLLAAVDLTAIIIIGIYSYFNLRSQSEMLLSEFNRHANQMSETIKKATRMDMLNNESSKTHEMINIIAEEKYIEKIRIFNKAGIIMYSNDSTAIGKKVNKKAEGCYSCHSKDKPNEKLPFADRTRFFYSNTDSSKNLGVMNPIYNEPSCWRAECHVHPQSRKVLGVLDIILSLKEVEQVQRKSTIKLAVFTITAILVLSLIITFFINKWLVKPVNKLMEATNQIGSGNLNYQIEDLSDNELGILGRSFNKMTEKLAEARLQLFQSDKMASLGRLAAGVAHEINNPLTGVLTYSSFLLKRTKDKNIQDDLKVIVRETKRSREIVKGLLDFARQSVPKKNEVNVNEVIENAISVVSNQLQLKHIKVRKEFDKELPMITVDSNQLQQVLINLVVNASDAITAERDGEIKISTSIINLSPYGISQIKNAVCRKRHNLLDNEIKIDGMPTIKVKAAQKGNSGLINLDPIYGKHRHKYGFRVAGGESIDMFCSRCETNLIEDKAQCPECGCNIYVFEAPPNGMVEGCTNPSCNWQRWKAVDNFGARNYVQIRIADNGCGIPRENLEKIFEPFFTTKGQKGTGLGLAVIWGIIDNHDGTINVESELGVGTVFTIKLPV